jgi:hypothetical protein
MEGADPSEPDCYAICSRNVFRDRPGDLLQLCRARDMLARKSDLQAVTDAGFMHHAPIAFIARSGPDYFYTVSSRAAASRAVQLALSPRYVLGGCPVSVWTSKYWVPRGPSTTGANDEQLRALAAVTGLVIDPMAMARRGSVRGENAAQLLIGAPATQYSPPVDLYRNVEGLMTVPSGSSYVVVGACREQAFDLHYYRKRSSLDALCAIMHTHFAGIASRLAEAMRKATLSGLTTRRDRDGLWDADAHETMSNFQRNLLSGLASLVTRQGIDSTTADNEMASNFVSAVVSGHVADPTRRPPEETCRGLLSCLTMAYHDAELWRGWTTALPHRGMGYGCMSVAKAWDGYNNPAYGHYTTSFADNNLSVAVSGMHSLGVDLQTPGEIVVKALQNAAPVPSGHTCPVDCRGTPVDATAILTRRLL